jgi:hypothetical protein
MLRRVAAGVVGVVAGAMLLSGCTPIDLPLAAVRLDAKGAPEAVLRHCGDDLIEGLSLDGAPEDSEKTLSGWWVRGKRHGTDAEFPLFSPPAKWRAKMVGKQRLVPGYTYRLAFGKAEFNYEYVGTVTFRAADLAKLKPGQVWADGRAMSRGKFEKLAAAAC